MGDDTHLLDIVHRRDADSPHLAVDQHLAGTTFTDAALQTAVAAPQRMTVYRETGLMQRFGDGVAFAAFHRFAFKEKLDLLTLRDVKDGVILDAVHIFNCFGAPASSRH